MTTVSLFPPLPTIPSPPQMEPDERQAIFYRIVGRLAGSLAEADGQASVANVVTGYRASAVDLGALQAMLERAIALMDMAQVRERWEDDLFGWMIEAIMTWVQRCKLLRMTTEGNGIRIELETQDDHGHYHYVFDAFPGRGSD